MKSDIKKKKDKKDKEKKKKKNRDESVEEAGSVISPVKSEK